MTPMVRTWRERVEATPSGCLVWQGRKDINGYARIGGIWAHRAIYEHEVGPIVARHELDHLCGNPPCVNPEHLEAVTKAEHCRRTMQRLGKDDKHISASYLRTLRMTYADIADHLGYSSKTGAASAVNAAIAKGLVNPDDIPRAHALAERDREDIIELRRLGITVNEIAEWYGLDNSTASRVSRGVRSARGAA